MITESKKIEFAKKGWRPSADAKWIYHISDDSKEWISRASCLFRKRDQQKPWKLTKEEKMKLFMFLFITYRAHKIFESNIHHVELEGQWFYFFCLNLKPLGQIPIVYLAVFQNEQDKLFIFGIETLYGIKKSLNLLNVPIASRLEVPKMSWIPRLFDRHQWVTKPWLDKKSS